LSATRGLRWDVVGFTIAEYFPRQVMHMQQILAGLPRSVIVRRNELVGGN
jgi:hypothetical protein